MTVLLLSLSLLLSVTAAQKPSPSWYIDELNTSKRDCDRYSPSGAGKLTNGPINIDISVHPKKRNLKQAICILFPPAIADVPVDKNDPNCDIRGSRAFNESCALKRVALGGWRHDTGTLGNCANDCCEWDPPISKKAQKPPNPEWWEISPNDNCSRVPSRPIIGPLFLRGQVGESRSICIKNPEDNTYGKVDGRVVTCSFNCCLFGA